jgi:hypothetical protein
LAATTVAWTHHQQVSFLILRLFERSLRADQSEQIFGNLIRNQMAQFELLFNFGFVENCWTLIFCLEIL